ncbi:MAG: cyclic nucleotide-binding domain-containing protein [Deltaproteobacteria bacterium]|nr:cyclic nucleotide-binding domain-containing protein [Deltaproteobacteria bacterium]
MDREEMKQVIASCELFDGLEKSDIDKIINLCREKTFNVGEYIFHQGDSGKHLYIIIEGQVMLERSINLGTRKGIVSMGILGQGHVLGSWSLLLDRSSLLLSSTVCQKTTRTLTMSGADLRNLMLINKNFGFNVLEKLCFLLKGRIQTAFGAMEKI